MLAAIFAPKRPRKTTPDDGSPLNHPDGLPGDAEDAGSVLLPEDSFGKVLSLERKRSERSGQRFVLLLVHLGKLLQAEDGEAILGRIAQVLSTATRETDIRGWYRDRLVIGVICTEIGQANITSVLNALHSKVSSALRSNLDPAQMHVIQLLFHVFPDDMDRPDGRRTAVIRLCPDLMQEKKAKRAARLIKRTIDIVGSLTALTLFSPLLIAIAIAVKLTSKGPILFKQPRVGQYGVTFTFLKFRSMYHRNNSKIHRDYVKKYISGKEAGQRLDGEGCVYKIKDDPRVTPVGRFLRKTSLDELPQLINVLRGEMSLVGPRPPIPYEVEAYEIWHRRRFLEVKPGITGLWQVMGRSRIKFDEMVRLDLRYAKTWSPWLDVKILLRTPGAVVKGEGAY